MWVDTIHIAPQLDARSWQLMVERQDKDFSLVDCSSFLVMKERGLSAALTTDRHFERKGFIRLLK
jgi:uncharacterized protein